jgi:hypothetical protein
MTMQANIALLDIRVVDAENRTRPATPGAA